MSSPHSFELAAEEPRATIARLALVGVAFMGAGVAGIGIRQLATSGFARLAPLSPAPWHGPAAMITGALLVALGAMLVLHRTRALAAWVVALLLLLMLVFAHGPLVAASPHAGFVWTNPCKILALVGGMLLAGSTVAPTPRPTRRMAASGFVALFLVVCGVQHFVYAPFVDTLVPAWIPPSARFWTWFAGVALIAGGAGLLVPRLASLAALLSAAMIFSWVLLLHIPRAVALRSAFEWDGVCEALALSGIALLLTGTTTGAAAKPAGTGAWMPTT